MFKSFIKYFILFILACVSSIAIYYMLVPEEQRVPIGIEVKS